MYNSTMHTIWTMIGPTRLGPKVSMLGLRLRILQLMQLLCKKQLCISAIEFKKKMKKLKSKSKKI